MAARGPADPADFRAATGAMAMRLFLLSLSILFAASILGVLVVRFRATQWPPAGSPPLPAGLWLSTAVLAVLSGVLVLADRAARAGQGARLKTLLTVAFVLGLAFLACQGANWTRMADAGGAPRASLFTFAFYTLTALHGLHVVGGLVPLAITAVHAGRGRYTAASHDGVTWVSVYWHFLGVVWVLLFAALAI